VRSAAGGGPVAVKRGAVNASSSLKTTLYYLAKSVPEDIIVSIKETDLLKSVCLLATNSEYLSTHVLSPKKLKTVYLLRDFSFHGGY
jgi:hypothetical protein